MIPASPCRHTLAADRHRLNPADIFDAGGPVPARFGGVGLSQPAGRMLQHDPAFAGTGEKMDRDLYDLPLTTRSDRAAACYRDGMDRMLAAWNGAGDAFDRAIAEDPDFALARIARARVHQMHMEIAEARAGAALARQLAATASPRERRHVEIMAATIEGQTKAALSGAEQYLEEFPRDALILALLLGAFGLYAFSGRADHDAARLAICQRHARHYGEDWWFLTYLGWSHTEAGNAGIGRALTERAFPLRPANANAAHGLSHALFEQGEPETGRAFLASWLQTHERASFLHGHLCWHVALAAIEAGDPDAALDIYRRQIRPAGSPYPPLNVLTDSASLLWRLSLAGASGLEPHWRPLLSPGGRPFRRRSLCAGGGGIEPGGFADEARANGGAGRRRQARPRRKRDRPLPRRAGFRRRRP
jgi:tetratricopeptide (TPR) repeat protein